VLWVSTLIDLVSCDALQQGGMLSSCLAAAATPFDSLCVLVARYIDVTTSDVKLVQQASHLNWFLCNTTVRVLSTKLITVSCCSRVYTALLSAAEKCNKV
jgi:hypothetical protein